MKKILFGIIALLLISTAQTFAQKEDKNKRPEIVKITDNEKEILADADYFFGEGNYTRALPLYV